MSCPKQARNRASSCGTQTCGTHSRKHECGHKTLPSGVHMKDAVWSTRLLWMRRVVWELCNWSIEVQLGLTNSKGLPVLFQGSHQGSPFNSITTVRHRQLRMATHVSNPAPLPTRAAVSTRKPIQSKPTHRARCHLNHHVVVKSTQRSQTSGKGSPVSAKQVLRATAAHPLTTLTLNPPHTTQGPLRKARKQRLHGSPMVPQLKACDAVEIDDFAQKN